MLLRSVIGSVTLAKMPKFMWEFAEIKVGHADRHVLIAPHSAEEKLQGFIQKTAGPLDGKPAVILI